MDTQRPVELTPEAQALLERLLQERDASASRLEVAVLSMRTVLSVPLDWEIRDIRRGFEAPLKATNEPPREVDDDGDN